jgi:hypothetical protein
MKSTWAGDEVGKEERWKGKGTKRKRGEEDKAGRAMGSDDANFYWEKNIYNWKYLESFNLLGHKTVFSGAKA